MGSWAEESRQAIIDNTYVCTPSFAGFIYRWWPENTLWLKIEDSATRTPAEQRYLAHSSTTHSTP